MLSALNTPEIYLGWSRHFEETGWRYCMATTLPNSNTSCSISQHPMSYFLMHTPSECYNIYGWSIHMVHLCRSSGSPIFEMFYHLIRWVDNHNKYVVSMVWCCFSYNNELEEDESVYRRALNLAREVPKPLHLYCGYWVYIIYWQTSAQTLTNISLCVVGWRISACVNNVRIDVTLLWPWTMTSANTAAGIL